MNIVQANIKKLIEDKAKELGFVKLGFAKAEVLENESANLKRWLDLGYDADMGWIKKGFDKRKDVLLILENAKTVISLAYNYYTPFKHDEGKTKISRYAWGKDYHKIIKKKLKELSRYIERTCHCEPSTEGEAISSSYQGIAFSRKTGLAMTVSYVDDGPLMDKSWAVRSGIGWMGKHTNVINPEYGSWIFLSEIITNIEFETYDSPIEDLCGSCRICIDACPTGAIVDEYVLDANLCISYQTIENRGEIPDYINLDGWIFGCDVCQDVCPFNKNDKITNNKDFYPKEGIFVSPLPKGGAGGFINKAELETITEEEFNSVFSDSPVKRTKFKGWMRNLTKCNIIT